MTSTPVELTYDSPSYDKYEDVKMKTIQERVLEWTNELCVHLQADYDRNAYSGRYTFEIQTGRKYHKIIADNSVHAFVDKNTGEVYKPASWRAPAKHVRYDLRIIQERMACYNRAAWAGGYLYMR